jgi:hypothetical protein
MVLSPDRRWIWNGQQWLPTWARPTSANSRKPSRWLLITGVVWIVCLSAWMVVGISLIAGTPPQADGVVSDQVRGSLELMVGLATFAALATIVWGALVGRRREHYWLWIAGAVGTGALMLGYVIAMFATPTNGASDNDNAAGAGVAIVVLPTAALVLILLWLGAGIGLLSRLIDRPRS